MADTCFWRSWRCTFEWDDDVIVPQDVSDRLAAFLEQVFAAIADLAAAVTDATDDDLVAVLGSHVLWRSDPARDPRWRSRSSSSTGWRWPSVARRNPIPSRRAPARMAGRRLSCARGEGSRGPVRDGGRLPRARAARAARQPPVRRARRAERRRGRPGRCDGRVAADVAVRAVPPEAYHVM